MELLEPASQKHIGPIAQDFYAVFQLDGVGNDTTINMIDTDGVNMIAIQALEKKDTWPPGPGKRTKEREQAPRR